MQNVVTYLLWTLFFLALSSVPGCDSETGTDKNTLEIPELGVSMTIPAGWVRDDSGLCHKDEYTGILMSEDINGKTFEQFAYELSTAFGSEIMSKRTLKIDGYDAIEVVARSPSAGSVIIGRYVLKGTKVIYASFVTSINDYSKYQSAIQKSLESMKIRS